MWLINKGLRVTYCSNNRYCCCGSWYSCLHLAHKILTCPSFSANKQGNGGSLTRTHSRYHHTVSAADLRPVITLPVVVFLLPRLTGLQQWHSLHIDSHTALWPGHQTCTNTPTKLTHLAAAGNMPSQGLAWNTQKEPPLNKLLLPEVEAPRVDWGSKKGSRPPLTI